MSFFLQIELYEQANIVSKEKGLIFVVETRTQIIIIIIKVVPFNLENEIKSEDDLSSSKMRHFAKRMMRKIKSFHKKMSRRCSRIPKRNVLLGLDNRDRGGG